MLQFRAEEQQIQHVLADAAVLFGLGLANVHLLAARLAHTAGTPDADDSLCCKCCARCSLAGENVRDTITPELCHVIP